MFSAPNKMRKITNNTKRNYLKVSYMEKIGKVIIYKE